MYIPHTNWSNINSTGISVTLFLLKIFGFLLSRLPNKVVRWISVFVGECVFYTMPSRRRIALSNLDHVFPKRSKEWQTKICKESFHRMIELGMLSIACGYLTKKRIKNNFSLSPSLAHAVRNIKNSGRGAIFLIPHTSLIEALTFIPCLLHDDDIPEVGVIYRSFKNRSLEKFVKSARERFGLKLLSRKRGFIHAMTMLKQNNIVVMLFDQNAGCSGATTTFLGRFAQTTEMPGILADRYKVPVYCLLAQRTGPWQATIKIEKLCNECPSSEWVVLSANRWLEKLLCSSDQACSDWLWAHNRWKTTSNKRLLFGVNSTRNWLKETKEFFGYKEFAKNFRVFVRLPNWLGDVVMAVPILRELNRCRPDVDVTIFCQEQYVDLIERLNLSARCVALPSKGIKYFFQLLKYRKLYPDVHVLFTHSLRGDIEARLMNATTRLGIYKDHNRSLLTDVYHFPPEVDQSNLHQTLCWGKFLQAYGLTENVNFTPYRFCLEMHPGAPIERSIGIMCGSLNNPKKRWPLDHWKMLIERIIYRYPGIQIYMYGTESDAQIADKIALGFGKQNIHQLCGTTNLIELSKNVQSNNLVIACDSGGMHIANMFGRPVVCIFGPTNAVHTGPIFNVESVIVRPEACPAKGGFPIEDVSVESVFAGVTSIMDSLFPAVRE